MANHHKKLQISQAKDGYKTILKSFKRGFTFCFMMLNYRKKL
ncbi:hypothetical protein NEOC95_001456 [Neochlamydia sp. AcF95]|nr:hypothetical protein [Neochlamydia sp. AcF95]